MEESFTASGGKFIFMQRLHDFDVLQHKTFPFIEGVEEQMQKFHEERTSAVLERRAADNDEKMEIIFLYSNRRCTYSCNSSQ